MKSLITLIFLIVSVLSFSQPLNRYFESANGRVTLLGEVSPERLAEDPFDEWYSKNHNEYQVEETDLNLSEADSITIFMGTWCGDSKREVPRFIKTLEMNNYDLFKLKILCLNTGFQNYKQAPERQESGVNIHRVPTFIFHDRKGGEIGRIVEEPIVSLEQDINTILKKEEYHTAYPIANSLIKYFEEYSLKELRKKKSKLIEEFKTGKNAYELNTYGYVLWSSFQIPKAQFVFELNVELFPDEIVVHQTFARFLNSLGENKEALTYLKKALEIDPKNENLIAMQSQVKEEME